MRPVPEGIARRYRADGYWRDEDLWTTVAAVAARAPHQDIILCGGHSVTFAELVDRAEAVGRGLLGRGIRRGDVVLVHGRNGIESTVALLGCAWLGAVMAPLPPMFSQAQVTAIAESSGARAVFCLGRNDEILRAATGAREANRVSLIVTADDAVATDSTTSLAALPAEGKRGVGAARTGADSDSLAMLVYSSGTTGNPKGVMHSANTIRYAIEGRAAMHGVDMSDICIVVCQFGFVGSIVFGLLNAAVLGVTSVLMTSWDPVEALATIERYRVSYGLFMSTHVHDLLHAPELDGADLASMKRAAMGGLPEARRREVAERMGIMALPGFGMSECLGNSSCAPGDPIDKRLTRDGRPYPGTEIRIVAPDGVACAIGTAGEIQVRGPSRCLGYYRAESLTDAAFTSDGFFRTGDRGSLDEDGYVIFAGREKDVIRRGGVTIVPGEVEAVLAELPAIRHVAIVALPDNRYGEIACACVVPRGGQAPSLAEITGFLGDRGVARYQWPERVALFEDFPRTPSLKVRKPALVEALVGRDKASVV